jgi:hypothetical protein
MGMLKDIESLLGDLKPASSPEKPGRPQIALVPQKSQNLQESWLADKH